MTKLSNAADDDERTTPVGLYHYASSYRAAATSLKRAKLEKKATHPDAPREFLYIHAIELYLKAFLRNDGLPVSEVRKHSHNFKSLALEYQRRGGFLMDEDEMVLDLLTADNVLKSRYIRTGAFTKPTLNALARTAKSLHETVRDAIRASGRVCGN